METIKFDPKKLEKLNNPERKKEINPDLIWEALNLSNPQVLVDIGAGTGFFAIPFSEKMSAGKVYACDLSEIMIAWMQENVQPKYENTIIPLKTEESKIALADGIADLVYMINLHHELEDPLTMLSEGWRLLKSGGKMMIIDWKPEETPHGPPVSIRINQETIENQLKQCKFSNVVSHDILPYHGFVIGEKS